MAITIDGTNGLTTDNAALKLDGTTLVVDDTNNRVGIGTASPAVALDVSGYARASTGILFGTDTAAANALDDYEEGTWTPTISGSSSAGTASYSSQYGKYTKIGNTVTISAWIDWSSGTGSGDLLITALPFNGSTNQYQAIGIGGIAALANGSSSNIPFLRIPSGSSYIEVKYMYWDGSSWADNNTTYDSAGTITLTGTYIVA